MTFDYFLEPLSGSLTENDLVGLQQWLLELPGVVVHSIAPDVWALFTSIEERDRRRGSWEKNPKANDYLTPTISISPTVICLSSVKEETIDRAMYAFVIKCMQRWTMRFTHAGLSADPEALIDDENYA